MNRDFSWIVWNTFGGSTVKYNWCWGSWSRPPGPKIMKMKGFQIFPKWNKTITNPKWSRMKHGEGCWGFPYLNNFKNNNFRSFKMWKSATFQDVRTLKIWSIQIQTFQNSYNDFSTSSMLCSTRYCLISVHYMSSFIF